MPKLGFVVDLNKCVGCAACTVACQAQNELEPEEVWLRVEYKEEGRFPTSSRRILPLNCQHCDSPPCVGVCPTRANYKRKDGVVLIDGGRCIGCKYCVVACPYRARVFNEERGTPGKCVLCQPRIDKGVQPACVLACPAKARYFGDFEDPESEVSKLVMRRKGTRLRTDLGAGPNIYYLR